MSSENTATILTSGTRVRSANGNLGYVVGNMTCDGSIVALRLDNGRNVSCLASKCDALELEQSTPEMFARLTITELEALERYLDGGYNRTRLITRHLAQIDVIAVTGADLKGDDYLAAAHDIHLIGDDIMFALLAAKSPHKVSYLCASGYRVSRTFPTRDEAQAFIDFNALVFPLPSVELTEIQAS